MQVSIDGKDKLHIWVHESEKLEGLGVSVEEIKEIYRPGKDKSFRMRRVEVGNITIVFIE